MSQIYAPGETITGEFPISSATGAAVNADSTPTLLLYQNGTVTGVSVSSANPATGRYTWSATIPGGYSARDEIRIEVTATVGGIALPATTVFRCRLDASVSSRSTYAGADTAGTTTLLARLTATRAGLLDFLDAAISSRSTYAGGDTPGTTTLLARLTNTRAIYLDALQYVTDARLTWLERLGTALEETSTGSGIWRLTTLALSRLGVDVTAIRAKTDNLPADPASNTQVNTRMATFTYIAPDNASAATAAAQATTAATQSTTAAAQATAAAASAATAATQSTTAAAQATNAASSASSADGKLTTGRLANLDAATPTRLGILDRLSSMMEQVSSLWRWNANTLSQAPTGSGGGGSAGKQLVHTPLRLVLAAGDGCECDASDGFTLNRGHVGPIRFNLVDADGVPISTTNTTLTVKITTLAGDDLLALDAPTEVHGDEGEITVQIDTSNAALIYNRFWLVVTRNNEPTDITSARIKMRIV